MDLLPGGRGMDLLPGDLLAGDNIAFNLLSGNLLLENFGRRSQDGLDFEGWIDCGTDTTTDAKPLIDDLGNFLASPNFAHR